ncbi:transcriptional regulator, TetR family [Seinonella peptonophila]|uniref:Transcriptional regulator, TetR family n=1 Tax=Seinonella peptonophila TaxID=112248 RepID=A0A1M4X840_9BACL|nr:TetR/AcrR family transcriptional regulator [Seinonella peptonophila]SHE89555.1 transcriptional regulator, TetR family [Seinonella peptonophila]
MISKTKLLWLNEGINVLKEDGHEKLTIDELSSRLKLTKGSFYHHFKNRQDYILALLQFWEDNSTQQLIHLSQKEETAREKLDRLTELVTNLENGSLEIKIRAWAAHDKIIRSYQQRVDTIRMNYVKDLCSSVYKDRVDTDLLAQIYLMIFIGAQHLIPPINGKDLQQLFMTISQLIPKK